ncbi:MAG: hypothetical protein KBD55_01475 [Candidatus Pacebacteria bacterium]|nr:hypothetical protein [Candidatus Paceibacterota bacterium]
MKNLQNIVLATVLVGLVSLVGYIVLNKKDTKPINEMPVVEAEFSTPAGSTTATTTTDLKTYTNTQHGFELKYPLDWVPSVSDSGLILFEAKCSECDPPAISVTAFEKYRNLTLKQIEEKYQGVAFPDSQCKIFDFFGISAEKCLAVADSMYPGTPEIFFFYKGVPFVITDEMDNDDSHQILSTFKFTNNVGTYIYYSKQGFSIELPRGFTPTEYQAEGGPAIQISLPVGGLAYVTNPSFWEKNNISSYTFVKEQKFGNNIFKVYLFGSDPVYWLTVGGVGYEFSAQQIDKAKLENLLQAFTLPIKVQFSNLAPWSYSEANDWSLAEMDQSLLQSFSKGKIVTMVKTFNGDSDIAGPDVNQWLTEQRADLIKLENSVKKSLDENGWKLTTGPTEGGFYHDYLYVKNGKPLVYSTGKRDAVTGGMYVKIQFQE